MLVRQQPQRIGGLRVDDITVSHLETSWPVAGYCQPRRTGWLEHNNIAMSLSGDIMGGQHTQQVIGERPAGVEWQPAPQQPSQGVHAAGRQRRCVQRVRLHTHDHAMSPRPCDQFPKRLHSSKKVARCSMGPGAKLQRALGIAFTRFARAYVKHTGAGRGASRCCGVE